MPFVIGLLFPLGFAPFHIPGFCILSLAGLFFYLNEKQYKQAFYTGFLFGLGMFGLGVSWVYVSLYEFGHLDVFTAALLTLLFTACMSLIPACMSLAFSYFAKHQKAWLKALTFSCLWLFSELFRSMLLGGFPWLMVGVSQIDTPLTHLLPFIGVYGVSFLVAFIAASLVLAFQAGFTWLLAFVLMLLTPSLLGTIKHSEAIGKPVSIGIIQADLSMRDKWDENLFSTIMQYYKNTAKKLLATQNLVILPESAIPMPVNFASPFLESLNQHALKHKSGLLLGIASPSQNKPDRFYNSMLGVGLAKGIYLKQHLVPFGEYTPKHFFKLAEMFGLDTPNMVSGEAVQSPIQFNQYKIASLICYELAFPKLIRQQIKDANFIVSVTDDGWFGHSLAVFQHQQMAQVLSKQTGRYQVFVNNDGLSAIIDDDGHIIDALPAFTQGVLKGELQPRVGLTPWALYGDTPLIAISGFVLFLLVARRLAIAAKEKRRYPNQSSSSL